MMKYNTIFKTFFIFCIAQQVLRGWLSGNINKTEMTVFGTLLWIILVQLYSGR